MNADAPINVPPHNYEAEQALLGAILLRNSAMESVVEFLQPHHFADPTHGRIYETAQRLLERGGRADPVTVKTAMSGDTGLADLGGDGYLARLSAASITIANAADYGRLILDLAQRRELIVIAEDLANAAFDTAGEMTSTAIQEEIEARLFRLSGEGVQKGGPVEFATPLRAALESAEAAYKAEGKLVGTSTGLNDLDRKIGGLRPSDLLILGGRPSMGKTSLCTNIAANVARAGKRALFFSLEMSSEQLSMRILAAEAGVSGHRIENGQTSRQEMERITDAERHIASLPLLIDDTPGLSLAAIRTRSRRVARQGGLSVIIVDYLQLIGSPGGKHRPENRTQELSEITRGLKALAKELNVPVLALSQLSRQVEQREDKRPMLSDLRESGSIEQDADLVMFVYREQYYLERSDPAKRPDESQDKFDRRKTEWEAALAACINTAEVIIAKQRRGPVGTAKLFFDPELTSFGNLDHGGN
jgi:replicative DNA helicase